MRTQYVVFDDLDRDALKTDISGLETFTFIGEIDGEIVVHEEYMITTDNCHIEKVSGKDEINLD